MTERLVRTNEEIGHKLSQRNFIRRRGLESYSKSLGFSIDLLASGLIKTQGTFTWYDMCCGYFNAGKMLSGNLGKEFKKIPNNNISIIGVDLDPREANTKDLGKFAKIEYGNVVNHPLPGNVDLVTCLKGLRYVDEFTESVPQALEHWYDSLRIGGLMAVEIDWISSLYEDKHFLDYIQDKLGDRANFHIYEDYPELMCRETSAVLQITKTNQPLGLTKLMQLLEG